MDGDENTNAWVHKSICKIKNSIVRIVQLEKNNIATIWCNWKFSTATMVQLEGRTWRRAFSTGYTPF
jgi:hypothetical protein